MTKTGLVATRRPAGVRLASCRDLSQWGWRSAGEVRSVGQHLQALNQKARFTVMLTSILDVLQKAPTGWTWS